MIEQITRADAIEMWSESKTEMSLEVWLDMLDLQITNAHDREYHLSDLSIVGCFHETQEPYWYTHRPIGPRLSMGEPYDRLRFSTEEWTTYKKWLKLQDNGFKD